jgi:RNA polymerase sigma-70 factor (ECF subfamily)
MNDDGRTLFRVNEQDSIPIRPSLLDRVKDPGNQGAWREFYETYDRLITRLAMKAGLREDEAKEVVQEVFISVSRNIGDFVYDPAKCSFKHWLSQMVRWRITDQFKKRLPFNTIGQEDPVFEELPGPYSAADATASEFEALWEAEWKRQQIEIASTRVGKLVSYKQYQIFCLHVLEGIPVNQVIQRLKVTRAQVYLAKFRVGSLFREQIRSLEKAPVER